MPQAALSSTIILVLGYGIELHSREDFSVSRKNVVLGKFKSWRAVRNVGPVRVLEGYALERARLRTGAKTNSDSYGK